LKTAKFLVAAAASICFATGAVAGKDNDTLNVEFTTEVSTLNYYYDSSREGLIASLQIYDTLVVKNFDTGEFEGNLATEWKWVDDKTLEFKLREGVTFHNGEPFNADDVVFTLNWAVDPANQIVVFDKVKWIKEAQKVDDRTVRLLLRAPFPAALDFLATAVPIYPDAYYAETGRERMGVAPIGTGPYKVTALDPGKSYTLEANTGYFAAAKPAARIGKIVVTTVPDGSTQIANLMSGQAEFLWQVPADVTSRLEQSGRFTVTSVGTMRIGFVTLDAAGRADANSPLKDVRIRQAINHAVDRKAMVDALVRGSSEVVNTPCSPIQFGCTTDVTAYDFNPEKARELLKEAGVENGFAITMTGYRDRSYAEAIVNFLADVGIRVQYEQLQYSALASAHMDGKIAMGFLTHGSSSIPDMSAITTEFFGGGTQDYARDQEVIDWIIAGNTSIDDAVRKENYTKALRKIADQAYWLPLFTYPVAFAYVPELAYQPTPDELVRFYDMSWK
jgi:peptide/nickel transport system substrate-binding protein